MPRKPRTPSYRLHKPSGRAVVTLDGKDFYLGRYGAKASRDEYFCLITEWLASGRRLPNTAKPVDLTVNELVATYWQFAQGYYRKNGHPTTEIAKIRAVIRPLTKLYGRTSVAAFGPLRLKTVRQELIDSQQCRRNVNQQVGRIKRMFKWGVENEYLPPDVFHGLQAVSGLKQGRSEAKETDPVRPVPEAYIAAALPHMPKQIRAMVQLQLLTGMRPGEVRLMRGCDLDLTGNIWSYSPASHKTQHHGIERTIYLGPQAQEVIRPFLAPDTAKHLFSPKDAVAEKRATQRRQRKAPVQPSQRNRGKAHPKKFPGDHYCREAYRHAIQRACRKAGVPPWTPAQLRHNAATRFRKEYGLEVAQIILGHQSAEVTQIYAERDREKALAVVAKIG